MTETWWTQYWSGIAVGVSLVHMLGSWLFYWLTKRASRAAHNELSAAIFIHSAVREMIETINRDLGRMKKDIKELDLDDGDWWKRDPEDAETWSGGD